MVFVYNFSTKLIFSMDLKFHRWNAIKVQTKMFRFIFSHSFHIFFPSHIVFYDHQHILYK